MDKIGERISVPVSLQGSSKVWFFGKPEETKEAKETFVEELSLVREAMCTS